MFSRSYCVLRYNLAFICAKIPYSRRICLVFEARRERKMTFQKAKPSRILHFRINFFYTSRHRKNLINGQSGNEIGPPKAPRGPHFMFVRRPPGAPFFHLSTFLLLGRFLRHDRALLEHSWGRFGTLLQPSWGPFGGLLGASAVFFCNSRGSSRRHTIQKRQAALRHGHLVHIFFIFFNEPLFLNTFMPATIPKVHHKTYIHKDGKKKVGRRWRPPGAIN